MPCGLASRRRRQRDDKTAFEAALRGPDNPFPEGSRAWKFFVKHRAKVENGSVQVQRRIRLEPPAGNAPSPSLQEIAETATLLLLGKDTDRAPGVDWKACRDLPISAWRGNMLNALIGAGVSKLIARAETPGDVDPDQIRADALREAAAIARRKAPSDDLDDEYHLGENRACSAIAAELEAHANRLRPPGIPGVHHAARAPG